MDSVIFFLCLGIAAITVFIIAFFVRYGFEARQVEGMVLIVPLDSTIDVEMKLKQALFISENSGTKGLKIAAIDLGMNEENKKIFELFSRKNDYIMLYSREDLKNIFSSEKINSKLSDNVI